MSFAKVIIISEYTKKSGLFPLAWEKVRFINNKDLMKIPSNKSKMDYLTRAPATLNLPLAALITS